MKIITIMTKVLNHFRDNIAMISQNQY